jgi:hypothetical protein
MQQPVLLAGACHKPFSMLWTRGAFSFFSLHPSLRRIERDTSHRFNTAKQHNVGGHIHRLRESHQPLKADGHALIY